MADKEDEEYLRLHLHDYRKENGYVFVFFEGDLKEFLEEYMGVFKTRNGEMTEWHLTMWDTVKAGVNLNLSEILVSLKRG